MTAKKVRVSDIVKGRWVKKEGMEPSFVVTYYDEEVSRARILGTVVAKFVSEDGNFSSVTIDDSTDTIRAKTFKTVKPIDTVEIGDLIDIMGKVREYNGEIYFIPEIIYKLENPNIELLRRLEILKKLKKSGKKKPDKEETNSNVKDKLRDDILDFIQASEDGVSYTDVLEKIKASEEDIESIINNLLSEGICYEPTPGKIKKI